MGPTGLAASLISAAKIVSDGDELRTEAGRVLVGDALVFREDSYDAIARIRRGRFYKAGQQQPHEWHVQIHPAIPGESTQAVNHILTKHLDTFYATPIWQNYVRKKRRQPLVLLGVEDRFTMWTIIGIETITTGEDVVTLKGRTSLGILPEIVEDAIPKPYRRSLLEALDKFVDAVHQSPPVSVIDRGRDAASEILLAYYKSTPSSARDLGKLATKLENEQRIIAASTAKIIARLHARGKPVENVRRKMRQIRQQDAELVTYCVGTLLCEVGWADWP